MADEERGARPPAYGMAPTPGGGWVPVPDPTALTTEAVEQAATAFRRELAALREVLEARLDAMDSERRLLLQVMDERATETARRFTELDLRFAERDISRQAAVQIALSAAKELSDARDAATDKATEKFEAAVREQIAQLAALAESGREQLGTQIQALKERLDRGEGTTTGAKDYRAERRLDTGTGLMAASVLTGLLIVAVSLYAALH